MNNTNRMYTLDGLRGVAAISVAIYHCDGSLLQAAISQWICSSV